MGQGKDNLICKAILNQQNTQYSLKTLNTKSSWSKRDWFTLPCKSGPQPLNWKALWFLLFLLFEEEVVLGTPQYVTVFAFFVCFFLLPLQWLDNCMGVCSNIHYGIKLNYLFSILFILQFCNVLFYIKKHNISAEHH